MPNRLTLALLLLSGCTALESAKIVGEVLTGDTPAVSAQVGRTNTDGLVNQVDSRSIRIDAPEAREVSQTSTTVNEEPSMWLIVLLILGWVMPSPQELFRKVTNGD